MVSFTTSAIIQWLFDTSGPILRYRVATDLMEGLPPSDLQRLREDMLTCAEVQRWLGILRRSRDIHGRLDIHAENALAKLGEYGLRAGMPELDEQVFRLIASCRQTWDPQVLAPFLVRAGYAGEPWVKAWLEQRLEQVLGAVQKGDFDFYLPAEEARRVPKAWQGKPIYRPEFGHEAGYPLPTCYDFVALAYWPDRNPQTQEAFERIAAFLSDPRFQTTPGGYGWDRAKRRCYAAGRVFLVCAEPGRRVLFLELGAGFASVRRSEWFRQGMAQLESSRDARGVYCFPAEMLKESRDSYYLYGGAHMGLGEDRKQEGGLERESTFRALWIRKRMHTSENAS